MFRIRKKPTQLRKWLLGGVCDWDDAMSGLAIIGGPGAGKTTGPLAEAELNILEQGCGILWLCAKPNEFEKRVEPLCKRTGRLGALKRFAPGGTEKCDLLTTAIRAPGGSPGAATALLNMIAQSTHRQQASGTEDGTFWADAKDTVFGHAINACWLVLGRCSLIDVYMMINTAPLDMAWTKEEQFAEWRAKSFCWQVLTEGMRKGPTDHDFILAWRYFAEKWPTLSDRTRSVIDATVTNLTGKFTSGRMAELVASPENTVGPEFVTNGGILAVDMPILTYREQGAQIAVMWKSLVQRAALTRKGLPDECPVAIIGDEYQWFITPNEDVATQTVAREAKLITVVAFQNLPMLYSMLGTKDAEVQADGWLSCIMTKVVMANTCVKTAEYFSKLFGYSWEDVFSESTQNPTEYSFTDDIFGRGARGGSVSLNRTPHWRPDVPPEAFGRLAKPSHGSPWAEGYVFQGGRVYENGKPWKQVYFRQQF
jgi:hypothetical protein